jgi:hypothetical protein
MDRSRELDERIRDVRKMEKQKKITPEEAEKLIQAIRESFKPHGKDERE